MVVTPEERDMILLVAAKHRTKMREMVVRAVQAYDHAHEPAHDAHAPPRATAGA